MITVNQIKQLISENRTDIFYNSRSWRNLAEEIRAEQNRECQYCKAEGKVGAADVVHHVKHLRDFPELAYSRYYTDMDGVKRRQLVCCCYMHHRILHPEKRSGQYSARSDKRAEKYSNEERW